MSLRTDVMFNRNKRLCSENSSVSLYKVILSPGEGIGEGKRGLVYFRTTCEYEGLGLGLG